MIRNIRHKGLVEIFEKGTSKRVDSRFHEKIAVILDDLDQAQKPEDLIGLAGFHPLKGERLGESAMIVTRNWRITFRFDGLDVTDADYEDYH
ncbi:MAG: type II toxin-antitoxin system RelE/ParE family toxin [Rhodospirillales bacterium]